jgi:predicted transcriptional regulator
VVAYIARNALEPEQLPRLVLPVRQALISDLSKLDALGAALDLGAVRADKEADRPAAEEAPPQSRAASAVAPAAPLGQTITDDHIVCLEEGGRFRSLKRHLLIKHNLTPDEYRAKWGLPRDYPMVAPSFAEQRSRIALRNKLGHSKSARKTRPRGR